MLSILQSHLGTRDVVGVSLLLLCLAFVYFSPRFGDRLFSVIERGGARLAGKRNAVMIAIPVTVIVLRLCLLPIIPVPFPRVHDEFSYLLAGDTFAHGRLTNPSHSMWVFFDTFHVLQHPTYLSKYPPAQGAFLALGQILGHPWIGVLLSCSIMCVTMFWALAGWLPPRWALLGTLIFILHVALFSYWIDSYWGGAAAAIGGSLVIGAYPRIVRSWQTCDGILLGLGISILANSRPFEGLIFCLPVLCGLMLELKRKQGRIWPQLFGVIIPLTIIGIACSFFMAYYNKRSTGDAFLFPYTLYDRAYLDAPVFVWEKTRPTIHYSNPQLDNFYNGWVRESAVQGKVNSAGAFCRSAITDVARLSYFFLWPELCLLLPGLLCLMRNTKYRFLLIQLAICVGGFTLVPWFQPHYAAPLVGTLFIILTQSLRILRHWRYKNIPLGLGFSRVVILAVVAFAPFHHGFPPRVPPGMQFRNQIVRELNSSPGQHLVIVRYSGAHDTFAEWVYNAADIDNAKIVWAREIPRADMNPLLQYFQGRHIWIVEPDLDPQKLIPYSR